MDMRHVELLEDRQLLSVLTGGTLRVSGSAHADRINVSKNGTQIVVEVNGRREIFAARKVKRIQISGGAGNDKISAQGDVPALIVNEGDGNDQVFGSARNDVIHGGRGNDYINGMAGNDSLFGDSGDDEIHGAQGNDVLDGGKGKDYLAGELGNDKVHGGIGDDTLRGGLECYPNGTGRPTCDPIAAKTDDDVLYGDDGNDRIIAGNGSDSVFGGAGDDQIQILNIPPAMTALVDGGDGTDTLTGKGTNTETKNVEVFA